MKVDMEDIEQLVYTEKRYNLTKTLGNNISGDRLQTIEHELLGILNKYKEELKISIPMPKVKTWVDEGKMNFIFLDRKTGRRILLGEWLANKEVYYER